MVAHAMRSVVESPLGVATCASVVYRCVYPVVDAQTDQIIFVGWEIPQSCRLQ